MNERFPYHLLNTLMIAGGVGFMLNMLNLLDFLLQLKIVHFLAIIGSAVILKVVYGFMKPTAKDPISNHPIAKRLFFLSMAVLATALVMRQYYIAHYNLLLYADILLQIGTLVISFTPWANRPVENDEILDA
ncbi:hypothetical protein K6119_08645 [Paracrocinitomix mangrovi]|uniref:hypothetical protein n=1 Tax=Paracrocinitomix mangrovi TaxID=2862509 RepID=UPI001C8D8D09|nr:hypothetical protein [Paracrocinitomix mangrovi]UKN03580.1 hypothetical protein K6119_08645 [Paracrocinitomix mangrovi]